MSSTWYRIILDTNIVVRGFINLKSPSGVILNACRRRQVVPLLSRAILSEYRSVLRRPAILEKYPELEHPRVDEALESLVYVSEYFRRAGAHFAFARDLKDSPFLELAIAASATHLITTDKDMLCLMDGRDEASKRFRQRAATRVQRPEDFISEHPDAVSQQR